MEIQAAVVRQPGGPFLQEKLQLAEPQADEVLVKVVATGLCHSDITASHFHFPPPPPVVLGHEGAGIVEKVGKNVTHVAPGDHVVLSFDSCGECNTCKSGHVAYCENFFLRNLNGKRPDGSDTLHGDQGAVGGCFFGQSSFADYALAHKRNTVKVRKDAPLELLGPLGCGIQTGAGAVLNVLKPAKGSSFALYGCGGVGLAALMGAKIAGCNPIIAIDKVPSRLELAKKLGATHIIDASKEDAVQVLTEKFSGMDFVVEASGVAPVIEQALKSTRGHGVCAILGVPNPAATININIMSTFSGKAVMGIIEGDADPHVFIPQMVDYYMDGKLPLDLLVKYYDFAKIDQAIKDSETGVTVKPILRMAHK